MQNFGGQTKSIMVFLKVAYCHLTLDRMLVHPTPPSPQQYITGAHSYLCVETVQAGLCLAPLT